MTVVALKLSILPLHWNVLYSYNFMSIMSTAHDEGSSGANSTTPFASLIPRRTFSPFARMMSSIVLNLPSSVPSLNQPKWSASKCLGKPRQLVLREVTRYVEVCSPAD